MPGLVTACNARIECPYGGQYLGSRCVPSVDRSKTCCEASANSGTNSVYPSWPRNSRGKVLAQSGEDIWRHFTRVVVTASVQQQQLLEIYGVLYRIVPQSEQLQRRITADTPRFVQLSSSEEPYLNTPHAAPLARQSVRGKHKQALIRSHRLSCVRRLHQHP